MCAAYEFKGVRFRLRREVSTIGAQGICLATLAGFARNEILDWRRKGGGVLLDPPQLSC